ncbi:neutral/alkaline non-lysosomal ceramidase N-terminal domain-containing protein [Paenibacillus allorhizosphaerae]|uniref:Neutral ceramidase n=1 Tax=Paenibacillus allorhizosphaerae TaxID=2849866 RepID=A0ABN7TRF4_9BACL|nr:neutral/alkaline non-lysosomal ceramidase N-terminal domain-containing protein [Paenibacillus allorhizosphaerae]CAG7652696.1 hypothetical protein PAECIP111802_05304 [Paenibacillus allorhizosphaerae]
MSGRESLTMGMSKFDITPSLPCDLGGYATRGKLADSVHSRLYGKCMAGCDGETRFALVSLDLLGIDRNIRDAVIRRLQIEERIPPDRVSLFATHTHCAIDGVPDVLHKGLWTTDPGHLPMEYRHRLTDAIVSGVRKALASLRKVRLQWYRAECPGVAGNRRDKGKTADPALSVLHICDPEGSKVIGGLLHFACHPTVIGPQTSTVSSDFPGAAASLMEKQHPGAVFLYANGAAGDISTRYTRRASDPAEAERVGSLLVSCLTKAKELPSLQQYDSAMSAFEFQDRLGGNSIRTVLQRIVLGGMTLWMIPGELFSSFASVLRQRNAGHVVVCYANDYIGYIPDEEAWTSGGYEVEVSRLTSGEIRRMSMFWENEGV